MAHRYSELPAEDKQEAELPAILPKHRTAWSRISLVVLTPFLVLTSLLALVGIANVISGRPALAQLNEIGWFSRLPRASDGQFLLGVGKADITGPVVEVEFMGYASLSQIGTGLRQRVYSRAFIIGDPNNNSDRIVYLVVDTAMGDTAVRNGILEGLAALGPDYAVYGQSNVAVTGTHQHSGPGAWLNYLLPQITSLGFSTASYQAIVDGSLLSIKRAHESLALGTLAYADTNITGDLDANINRSPYSYLANPADERAKYEYNVDKGLTMLRFQRASDGLNIGVLSWHAVHGTSMLENNTHVTGDNKGVSSYLFEQAALTDPKAAPGFVAGFSQANVGDTSPNILGAWCDDGSGEMCTFENSTCGGKSEQCHGRGPEFQKLDLGVSSCYEIGRRVFAGAQALYNDFDSVSTPVTDTSVKSYHTFNDMSFYEFPLPNGTKVQTCPAALGYGFAGGTTDGPGAFDFVQGDNNTQPQNPFWELVSDLLTTPTPEQVACQSPKPILLDIGQMSEPYAWGPNIVDIQSLRVGQFIMIISPSEATTMTGRRWRDAVAAAAESNSITTSTPKVVLGGPANTYAHYAATPEEYGIQRYEGASTLYGPWESYAYIYLSTSNIQYLASGSSSQPAAGPTPPDNRNASASFSIINKDVVVFDNPTIGKSFGDCTTQPNATYSVGDVINATFVGANPRNNFRLEGTFTAIEQLVNGAWTQVRNDSDWALVYTWTRTNTVLGYSDVTISWETESNTQPGTYRTVYNGDSKTPVIGSINSFTGYSGNYTIS